MSATLLSGAQPETDPTWAWISIFFFGLCSCVFAFLLFRPQRLLLNHEGFTLSGGLVRSPKQVHWHDIEEFYLLSLPRGGGIIGYNFKPGARPQSLMLKLNRGFGAEAGLPRGWTASSEEMVEELNEYRNEVLLQDGALGRS